MANDTTNDATDSQADEPSATNPATATEQGGAKSDEPLFTQRQVNAMMAAAKRRYIKEASAEAKPPETTAQPGKDDTIQKLDATVQTFAQKIQAMEFDQWAARKGLTALQATVIRDAARLDDSASWDAALDARKEILAKLTDAPGAPAPAAKPSMTRDAVGGAGVNAVPTNPFRLTGDDLRTMTRQQKEKVWDAYVESQGGGTSRRFFRSTPRNGAK